MNQKTILIAVGVVLLAVAAWYASEAERKAPPPAPQQAAVNQQNPTSTGQERQPQSQQNAVKAQYIAKAQAELDKLGTGAKLIDFGFNAQAINPPMLTLNFQKNFLDLDAAERKAAIAAAERGLGEYVQGTGATPLFPKIQYRIQTEGEIVP